MLAVHAWYISHKQLRAATHCCGFIVQVDNSKLAAFAERQSQEVLQVRGAFRLLPGMLGRVVVISNCYGSTFTVLTRQFTMGMGGCGSYGSGRATAGAERLPAG